MAVAETRQVFLPDAKGRVHIARGEEWLSVRFGSTNITVETAKKPGQPWKQKAKEDIETARAAYRVVWGDVPAWDAYDRKESTYNYIAYVEYPDPNGWGVVSEALSNRMVTETPEDIMFYRCNGIPLKEVLEENLYRSKGLPTKPIAAQSRIGSIRAPNAKSNLATVEAFAAIKLQMVEDARRYGIDHITSQLRPDMEVNIFTVDGETTYKHPPTEDILGLPRGTIHLDRDNPVVVYHILRYPGYFLDTNGVYLVVKQLIDEGKLSIEGFREQTGLENLSDLLRARNIKALVPLIHADNRLGIILQDRLLSDVGDGIYSSMSHVDEVEQMALAVLEKAVAKIEANVTTKKREERPDLVTSRH